ncbi:MAG: LysR family transcriptional regulator [Eggerthellaceae bacterium]|jgi:DNA-binding transcriptional LysR family regulator
MPLQKYAALRAVVETGSFSKAADMLGYSQSSISRMISDLESEWGIKVLKRNREGAVLTNEGEQIYPAVLRLCSSNEDLTARINDIHGLVSGTLRIGTFSSIATHWLPPVMAAFKSDYPSITCELLLGSYSEIEHWLETGRIDCGFTRLPTKSPFQVDPIADDELFVVIPKGHELSKMKAIPAEKLLNYPYIALVENDDVEDAGIFDQLNKRPETDLITWDDYSIMAMVERGMGFSILPGLILNRIPYQLDIRPLAPKAIRHIAFVTRDDAYITLAVRRFEEYLDLIKAEARSQGGQ